MTLAELKTLLDTTTYSVAYQHFPESNVPTMPFICYMETGSDNFAADGKVYEPVKMIQIQLFTKTKDTVAEGKVETALQNIYWNKTAEYNDDERCYRVVYEIEI